MKRELGDYVSFDRQMCRVVAVTYHDGRVYRLRLPDGSVVDGVTEDRLRGGPALVENLHG